MFGMGGSEFFLIILVFLLFFGSNKIPEIARGLGKGMREFKDATNGLQRELNESVREVKEGVEKTKDEITKDLK
jgi:sec-independent protein translocase protein TatA